MSKPIVYYDGLCGLCDGLVRFIAARDTLARYRFAPLQGETARFRLGDDLTGEEMKTVVLEPEPGLRAPRSPGGLRFKSDAAIAILAGLSHGWGVVNVLRIVPRPIRDVIYDFVARHRGRWFGVRDVCRTPGPEEQDRFLP